MDSLSLFHQNLQVICAKINIQTTHELTSALKKGNRIALSKAITLVESQNEKHEQYAQQLLQSCLADQRDNTIRLGITGTPGVGKSTFVEALGMMYIQSGHRVAVLTIDPSSPENQGSILGDKSRMDRLSNHPDAYVRSSPSRTNLGGTTDRTRETIALCEAAGYDIIIIETVGVGQSETEIRSLVDKVCLLVLPGSGDEIQGIKRGIVEVADAIFINKSDKFDPSVVKESVNSYLFATHLRPSKGKRPSAKVIATSAISGSGMEEAVTLISSYISATRDNGYYLENRQHQMLKWLERKVEDKALSLVRKKLKEDNMTSLQLKISAGELSINEAAELLLSRIMK